MDTIIEVKNLTKDYGFKRGVFNISFAVKKGEVFGFLGPNGAGKSTTVRHLMGFSKPDEGHAFVFGKESFKEYPSILKEVGYIPGELSLPSGLTGFEFIKMIQDLTGVYNNERLDMLLDLFKLPKESLRMFTKRMSLGSKRKLAIVVAFMSDPSILILDEPTSGLDPFMQDIFIEFLKEEKKRGKTILLSSHLFNEVEQTCDRISIIKDGEIVSNFSTKDFKHKQEKTYKIRFRNDKEFIRFSKEKHSSVFTLEKTKEETRDIYISTHDNNISSLIDELTAYDLEMFTHEVETLEDYFLSFYSEEKDFGGIE